jgi:hypothetical protein
LQENFLDDTIFDVNFFTVHHSKQTGGKKTKNTFREAETAFFFGVISPFGSYEQKSI